MREDSNKEMARCTDLHPLFVALELFIIGFAEKPLYVTILLAAFFVNCAKIDELQ